MKSISSLQPYEEPVNSIIDTALAEDISHGDITSEALIPADLQGKASLLIKAEGILAGIEITQKVFLKVDPSLEFEMLAIDGTRVKYGDIVATVSGSVASMLKAERVALDFVQKLSGIATEAAKYVAETQEFGTIILDTRKTTPGLRLLEKYATCVAGAQNHRLHLGSWVLIKDNHLVALRTTGMSLKEIVAKAKKNAPDGMIIEIEVTTVEEAKEAVEGGATMIMLDNMNPDQIRRAMNVIPTHIKTEASGGITLANIHEVASTGVNYISSGAFIHSVKTLDISLEFEAETIKPD